MPSFVADLLPVLALFAAGAVAGRRGLIGDSAADGMKKIVASVALPALLFSAFAGTKIEAAHLILIAAIFASCALMGLAGSILSRLLKLPRPSTVFLFQGFEAGMLGYALFGAFFGLAEIPRFATADLGQVVYVFTILMSQMLRPAEAAVSSVAKARDSGGAATATSAARRPRSIGAIGLSMLKSPVILAIAAGIIVSAIFGQRPGLPWAQGGFLAKTLATVGGLTTPLVCVSVGYGLRKGISGGRSVLKAVLARMAVAMPIGFLIAYALLPLLGIPAGYSRAVVVLFLLPPPYIIPIFRQGREETDYISAVITLHTAMSMAAIVVFALASSGGIAAGALTTGAGA